MSKCLLSLLLRVTQYSGEGFDLGNKTVYVRFGDTVVKGEYGGPESIGVITPPGTGMEKIEISFNGKDFSTGSNVTFSYDAALCPQNCSGNGVCLDGKCLCNKGFGGPDCAQKECVPANCSGHGTCADGNCNCDSGWDGVGCDHSKCSNKPCSENGECIGPDQCKVKFSQLPFRFFSISFR